MGPRNPGAVRPAPHRGKAGAGSEKPATIGRAPVGMTRECLFAKRIASLDEVFAFLETFYAVESVDAKTSLTLSLAVEELFTNLVKYNTESHNPVTIRIGRSGTDVNVELIDRDVDRFDPSTLPRPNIEAPMAERNPGGLGLYLVQASVDKVDFQYADRVMRIVVVKSMERGDV